MQGLSIGSCGGVQKPCMTSRSIFKTGNTHPIGPATGNKRNLTVTVDESVDNILGEWARELAVSRNELSRRLMKAGAEVLGGTRALAFKAAMKSPATRQTLCSIGSALIIGLAFWQSVNGANLEVRKPRNARREFSVQVEVAA